MCALWQFICYLIASRWMWPFLLITLAKPILYSHKRWETLQHKRYQIMFLHWFGKNDQLPLTYSMEGAVHGCWKSSKKKDNGNLNILSENRLIKVIARLFFFLFLGVNTDNWEMVPLCRGQPPVRMFRPICVCVFVSRCVCTHAFPHMCMHVCMCVTGRKRVHRYSMNICQSKPVCTVYQQ